SVGRRVARQGEQAPHHVLHLLFSGVAVADHRLLDLERGVLRDREAGEHRGADGRAARLPERERRLRIGVDEHYLDRYLAGGVRPAVCIAAFPVARSAGAQISSTEPSSFLSTSSAPASSAASMTRSSLVPGANTNWPTWRNR